MVSRRSLSRRIVLTVLLVVLLGGCTLQSDPVEMSRVVGKELLPTLGASASFGRVGDWRSLDRPTPALREWFDGQRATYRVIKAGQDFAELAVWQTGAPGPEPFNANQTATGAGCVSIGRHPESVTTAIIDCPATLQEDQPSRTDTSWGRDSAAMSHAEGVIDGLLDQEVRWLMTKELGGYPRTTTRTLEQVVAAVQNAPRVIDVSVDLNDVRQEGRTVTGFVIARAAGWDPVAPEDAVDAHACGQMSVDLDNVNPNLIFQSAPC